MSTLESISFLRVGLQAEGHSDDFHVLYTPGTPTVTCAIGHNSRAFVSSLISTIVGYPIDTIKSRLQTYPYKGTTDCVVRTWKEEGPRAFLKGVTIPLFSATVMRTLSFSIYNGLSVRIAEGLDTTKDAAIATFLGGFGSGLAVSVIACPFELTKLASQLDQLLSGSAISRSPRESARSIYQQCGGLSGFWSGWRWHAARDSIGTGLFFTTYYSTKLQLSQWSGGDRSWHHALAGAICGCSAWTIVYPIDTIKAVNQKNMLTGKHTFKVNTSSMYRGVSISLFRSGLLNAVNFTLLEKFLSIFRENKITVTDQSIAAQ